MGFNSVVFICNDQVNSIQDDTKRWWQAVWAALVTLPYGKTQGAVYGTEAVWCQHADVVGLIMVGGNHATILGSSSITGGAHHSEEDQDKLLKEILRERGYVVYKKKLTNVDSEVS